MKRDAGVKCCLFNSKKTAFHSGISLHFLATNRSYGFSKLELCSPVDRKAFQSCLLLCIINFVPFLTPPFYKMLTSFMDDSLKAKRQIRRRPRLSTKRDLGTHGDPDKKFCSKELKWSHCYYNSTFKSFHTLSSTKMKKKTLQSFFTLT